MQTRGAVKSAFGGGILAADYGKNLFNHNQALIAENEKLKAENDRLRKQLGNAGGNFSNPPSAGTRANI
jgi:regulator of replication initiation timing